MAIFQCENILKLTVPKICLYKYSQWCRLKVLFLLGDSDGRQEILLGLDIGSLRVV